MYGRHCVVQQVAPVHVELGLQPLGRKIAFVGSLHDRGEALRRRARKITTAAVPPLDAPRLAGIPEIVNFVVDTIDAIVNVPLYPATPTPAIRIGSPAVKLFAALVV